MCMLVYICVCVCVCVALSFLLLCRSQSQSPDNTLKKHLASINISSVRENKYLAAKYLTFGQ